MANLRKPIEERVYLFSDKIKAPGLKLEAIRYRETVEDEWSPLKFRMTYLGDEILLTDYETLKSFSQFFRYTLYEGNYKFLPSKQLKEY